MYTHTHTLIQCIHAASIHENEAMNLKRESRVIREDFGGEREVRNVVIKLQFQKNKI